jgi:signal transduction histidine kinase
VMDAPALLGMLDSEPRWQDLNLQLQRLEGEEYTRFWGADLQPGRMQQTMQIPLPGVTWRLVLQRRDGDAQLLLYRLGLYAGLLLLLLAVGYVLASKQRQQREHEALRAETERIKNEFISTVNHELRTPLTSILGTLGLLQGGAVGALPEEAKRMLALARRNADHLLKLISDLLDIDKIIAGQLQLELQDMPLDQLLRTALQELNGMLAQRELQLEYNNPFDEARVRVDATRFKQVLDNLLARAGAYWRIEVSDQGEGIPPAFQDKVFERFSQADSSSQRKTGGTGLGLPITRGLVEQMGGEVGFTTSAAGTCFYLLFPDAGAAS